MGNTFEIHSWLPTGEDSYKWKLLWTGEDQNKAFSTLENLKSTGEHPCLKLEWR
jgi:hypothetical protein